MVVRERQFYVGTWSDPVNETDIVKDFIAFYI